MITWKHWWLKWDKVLCCIGFPCRASSRFIKLGGFVALLYFILKSTYAAFFVWI